MSSERAVGETQHQGWEIGVRRTIPLKLETAWETLLIILGLPLEIQPKGAKFTTADQTQVEIRSCEPYSLLRMKWQPADWDFQSTLQIRVRPAKNGSTLSIHHEWLQNAEQRAAMQVHWMGILEQIKTSVNQG